ncbi:hypothetical protein [Halioglobus maricola]|uniref:hypothetical protein n=1 Tax=Halioglobus maricola TaxID=2601894 RepID=UPI00197AD6BD|nr:hypothetical protein [Halioglobus maricola]
MAAVIGCHDDGWLFDSQSRVVFEHLITLADRGTVTGYRLHSEWGPVTAPSPEDDYLSYVQAYHSSVLDYADTLVRMGSPLEMLNCYMEGANAALQEYLCDPKPREVYVVAQFPPILSRATRICISSQ